MNQGRWKNRILFCVLVGFSCSTLSGCGDDDGGAPMDDAAIDGGNPGDDAAGDDAAIDGGDPGDDAAIDGGEPGDDAAIDGGDPGDDAAIDGGEPGDDAAIDGGEPLDDAAIDGGDPGDDAAIDGGEPGDDAAVDAGQDAGPPAAFDNAANWAAFDASSTGGLTTRGYFGAAFDGRWVYFAPCRTVDFHGVALRYDTQADFQVASSWESHDAGYVDTLDTVGYGGAVFDGRYVYYVPFADASARHARVLRYDTQADFTGTAGWSAYDAGFTDGMITVGYNGAVFDGRYIYLVPFGYDPVAHGRVLRYDTQDDFFSSGAWSAFDAGFVGGLSTIGYYGAAFDGRYVYFAPFHDGSGFHGRMLRYDTQADFYTAGSWSAFDGSAIGGLTTIGYKGAVYDGRYIYYVPFRDGTARHGRVLRYDTQGSFDGAASWTVYDAGVTDGLDTRGYVGATFDGRFVYFVPYSGDGNVYHGRALRYDTQGPFDGAASWTGFDAGNIDGLDTKGYKYSTFDGRYVYFTPYANNNMFHGIALRYDTAGVP